MIIIIYLIADYNVTLKVSYTFKDILHAIVFFYSWISAIYLFVQDECLAFNVLFK